VIKLNNKELRLQRELIKVKRTIVASLKGESKRDAIRLEYNKQEVLRLEGELKSMEFAYYLKAGEFVHDKTAGDL